MLEPLMVTLVILILIVSVILVIRLTVPFIKRQAAITRLVIGTYFCFLFGVIWESCRILYLIFTPAPEAPFERFAFALKVFFILLAISLVFQIIIIVNRQSGHQILGESYIRYFYLLALLVFTIINGYSYYQSKPNAFGFSTYQVHPIVSLIIFALYIPLLIFIVIRLSITIKDIKNKSLFTQVIFLATFFVVIEVERYIIITFYEFLSHPIAIIIDLSVILIVAVTSLILFIKNIDLLEEISTYFGIRSIYLIRKDGGQMIYGFDFRREGDSDPLAPDRLLLGGFIYSISHGLASTLKTRGELESIQIGDLTLIFKHGKYVIGILFLTEETPMVSLKLLTLMERFERHYETDLEHWTGDLTKVSTQALQDWIDELFR
ncbi:MAG: hypothetical protein HWN65_13035 [Candidatus Helarchaeota archaeon]|nr:hypothetical protein [Candidatus Helarchaeota archaeon]